jgi:hypothetical protein
MLPDRTMQLLTSYVDGELGARDREAVTRLLEKSPAARAFLQQLVTDARSLRELTRFQLGQDFSAKVMRAIAEYPMKPALPLRPPAPTVPSWLGIAVAAAILVMISAGSYWYFSPQRAERVPAIAAKGTVDPLAGQIVEGTLGKFGQTGIRFAAKDLAEQATMTRLENELRQDNAFHVDLAVQDNGVAVQRLANTLRDSGIKVLMGAGTERVLKQHQKNTSYVLYAENLSPEELAQLLEQLGRSVNPAAQGGRKEAAVEQVVVDLMTEEHRQKLSKLLGVLPVTLEPAKKKPNDPPTDLLNKKLIAGNAKGQGSQPNAPKAGAQPDDRIAMVLAVTADATVSPADLSEVKTFVSLRREQRPGTVQVVLIVHEARA